VREGDFPWKDDVLAAMRRRLSAPPDGAALARAVELEEAARHFARVALEGRSRDDVRVALRALGALYDTFRGRQRAS
jgi:hypothetical protein